MIDARIGDNVTMPDLPKAARRFANGDEILGRYVVQSELGQGGMGVVYKCFDKIGGVEVAVKGLPPEVSHNSDEMEAVRENFQLVSELHHPNIAGVRTLEKDSATGDYYLVMTLARGVSLRHWLRQHGGKEHRTEQLNVLRQIASALDYAHNAGPKHIIHRDIKPENIMVDENGRVMVLDFGLAAQVRSSLSRVSQVVTSRSGTPAYKSPEQWLAQAQRAPSDQYSLGVIAYQMFAGELPFDSDDLEILKHAVVFDPVPAIPSEDKDINAVFVKSLAKKPQDRFTSCAAFIDALVGKDHPVRSAVRMRIAVALLGVLAVAGGWWAWKSQNDAAKPRQNEIARQLEGVRRESEKLQLGEVKQQGERIAEDRRRTEKEVDAEDALSAGSKAEIGRVVAEKRIVEEAEVAVSKAETETHYLADPRPGEFYQVQPGDTIYGIAKKAYGKISGWKKIRTANKALISSDNRVSPGWRIFIPNDEPAIATSETNSSFSITNKATRIQEQQSERALFLSARYAFADGKYGEAESLFRRYVKSYPNGTYSKDAKIGLNQSSIRLGKKGDGKYTDIVDGVEWTYVISNGQASVGGGKPFGKPFDRAVKDTVCGALSIPDTLGNCVVTDIGQEAFSGIALTTVTIPQTVINIEDGAFCVSGLTSVMLPPVLTHIGRGAFSFCRRLSSVMLPPSVKSMGDHAFMESGLESIEIPSSVTNVGRGVLSSCDKLREVVVCAGNPNYVSRNGMLFDVEMKTLLACPGGLTVVKIPSSVNSIGCEAFRGCKNLTAIAIPSGVKDIGEGAFEHSHVSLVSIPSTVTNIGDSAFYGCEKLTKVSLPTSVTSIGKAAFCKSGLTSAMILPSVMSIGAGAFSSCLGLRKVEVHPWNANFSSKDGMLFDAECKALLCVPGGAEKVSIPTSVTRIVNRAMEGCVSLKSVTIPDSVSSIGARAFHECESLQSVSIPASVTNIGEEAFWCCRKLAAVTIPPSVSSVDDRMFRGCSSLRSIIIPSSVKQIGVLSFDYCRSLTTVVVPSSVTNIGNGAFMDCNNLTTVVIPSSVINIGRSAFKGAGLKEVYVDRDDEIRVSDMLTKSGVVVSNLSFKAVDSKIAKDSAEKIMKSLKNLW